MPNQETILKTNSTIGIIGGGQLGRMACFAAHSLGFRTVIFTDQKNSPASFVTNQTIVADYDDKEALKKFASLIDVATFEFENIPAATVEFLSSLKAVYPNADVLKTTQHRILEKDFLNSIDIKTADYAEIKSHEDLLKNLEKFGTSILKTATMGYDGKGQFVFRGVEQAEEIWRIVSDLVFSQKLILEKFCPFESEISVIVARSKNGETATYEPLTNIHKLGILDKSIYPAKISESLKIKAQKAAEKIADKLNLIGVLAVEFFVMNDETLLVNELAPRPHNSGHFSMDASITSQFEQLIRAISGLSLGSTQFHSEGHMKNLIGQEVNNLEEFTKNPRAKIHLYGKDKVAEGRKMGHVNILNSK